MEDKQKKYLDNQYRYLDKVVEFIVRDTIIDYDKEEIHYPFTTGYHYPYPLFSGFYSYPPEYDVPTFWGHCKDVYGLTDPEIGYVWREYRNIILDKINGR
jgi:hypothetical protein